MSLHGKSRNRGASTGLPLWGGWLSGIGPERKRLFGGPNAICLFRRRKGVGKERDGHPATEGLRLQGVSYTLAVQAVAYFLAAFSALMAAWAAATRATGTRKGEQET